MGTVNAESDTRFEGTDPRHVATTHIIRMPDGTEPHRHGKDILLGSLKFAQVTE
jgi:hypothetical protein